MSEEDKKKFLAKQKEENSQIQRDHQRIQEKVKEIRQNFSKAVTAGKTSGSGKLVYEFYDELVHIWGGDIRQQNPLPMALTLKVLFVSNLYLQLQPRIVLIACWLMWILTMKICQGLTAKPTNHPAAFKKEKHQTKSLS